MLRSRGLQYTKQWRSQNVEKKYASQRGTTGTSSGVSSIVSLFKMEIRLKERICSQRERILFLRAVPYGMEITCHTS